MTDEQVAKILRDSQKYVLENDAPHYKGEGEENLCFDGIRREYFYKRAERLGKLVVALYLLYARKQRDEHAYGYALERGGQKQEEKQQRDMSSVRADEVQHELFFQFLFVFQFMHSGRLWSLEVMLFYSIFRGVEKTAGGDRFYMSGPAEKPGWRFRARDLCSF